MENIIAYAKLNIPGLMPDTEMRYSEATWKSHLNTAHYTGDWTVLPLRSPGGDAENGAADLMGNSQFANTIHMCCYPEIKQTIDSLRCEVNSVRLLNLKAGATIKEHRDVELSFENGEARLHFPLQTNDLVDFYVQQERIPMKVGDCWYINANLPHRVSNQGSIDRIHLVVDCQVNTWLKTIFSQAQSIFANTDLSREKAIQIIKALREMGSETAEGIAKEYELKYLN